MRFKTVIKVVSEAQNKGEALEVVEEYLAGNITSGVDVKCFTRPVASKARMAGIAVLSLALVLTAGISLNSFMRHSHSSIPAVSGGCAVQPPLSTSFIVSKGPEFKNEWSERQTKEALELIKR